MTAAVVYGLSLGNHELTLLLAPGIGLFVLAVEPRIVFRPRFLGVCLVALLATAALVYLELPIRAGILRAPLVYAHPETLGGFLYVVLAQQFQGSLVSPLADLGQKLADLWAFAGVQLGPLAWLVPIGFAATALRRPRYALLTGPTFVITCWFTASYQNAEIDRYYLGPALIAISWAAIATGALVDAMVAMAARLSRGSEARGVVFAAVVGIALLYPSLLDLNDRRKEVDASSNRAAAQWLDAVLDPAVIEPNAVVLSWWSYSTPLWYAQRVEGRRPDIEIVDDRTRLDENLGEVSDVIDANLGRRPVVVIEQDPNLLAGLSARYRLTRLVPSSGQPIYRIDGVLAEVGR